MTAPAVLIDLYRSLTGSEPESVIPLAAAGSNRCYLRLCGTRSLIGVVGTCREENEAFIYLSRHFADKGLNVPRVLAVSADSMAYLQQDLGDTLLFDAIAPGRLSGAFSHDETELLAGAMRALPRLQFRGAEGLDFSKCYPLAEFNRRSILWDLNYFKYCFLKAVGVEFMEDCLEDDFEALASALLGMTTDTFMYRDFQSRNIMLHDGHLWFIDFQGGRKGPYYYDVASFLWQAKANLSAQLRCRLVAEYVSALREYTEVDEAVFNSRLRLFVLFRTLQVLGAYGFRGYFEKKAHFMQSVPYAMSNLRGLLETPFSEFPYLDSLLRRLVQMERFAMPQPRSSLTVRVTSFSYKKGIPDDASGNGGGFVFDCRALHNPGRYDRYKPLTGLDSEVIDFLEAEEDVHNFLNHCYALVDAAVQRYISRGFTDLMVSFGCTGGRHRSVFCAQRMAEHLHSIFGCTVDLRHREQGIHHVYNSSRQ